MKGNVKNAQTAKMANFNYIKVKYNPKSENTECRKILFSGFFFLYKAIFVTKKLRLSTYLYTPSGTQKQIFTRFYADLPIKSK